MKKKPTDVQDSHHFTEILQKAIVTFKECGETKSCERVYIISLPLKK